MPQLPENVARVISVSLLAVFALAEAGRGANAGPPSFGVSPDGSQIQSRARADGHGLRRPRVLELGPVKGLTTSWHAAPVRTAIPLDTSVDLRQSVPGGASVVWAGAEEVFWDGRVSVARRELSELGATAVHAYVQMPGGKIIESGIVFEVVDIDIDQIRVARISPSVVPHGLDEGATNADTMDVLLNAPSIAALRDLGGDRYRTSIDRVLKLRAEVDPPDFAPLIEWRIDRPAAAPSVRLGAAFALRANEVGVYAIQAGPPDQNAGIELETYAVKITSPLPGVGFVLDGQPAVFTAETNPPGIEHEITWLASTMYGDALPMLAQGPTFTVQFDNTAGPHPDTDEPFQWLGVRADNARFEQQQVAGACCIPDDGCIEAVFGSECAGMGGTYLRDRADCTTDADNDRIPDAFETNDCVVMLPCVTGTHPNRADTDRDELSDGDEVFGTVDGLDLPALGADPCRKDIFIETDWHEGARGGFFHSHRPTEGAVALIVAAFAAAPVPNRDGSSGVALHVDYGQGGAFTGGNRLPGAPRFVRFDSGLNQIKANHFAPNRKGYFHYAVFTHSYDFPNNPSGGYAEIGGDDFIVTAYGWDEWDAGIFMHELGHNLNLRHGGNEDTNYKPNYNSNMNYRFIIGIDWDCNGWDDWPYVLDYSQGTRIRLNENRLNESRGVCGDVPVDWNWNGVLEVGLELNINCASLPTECGTVDEECYDSFCTVLRDYNDWANINYGNLTFGDRAAVETIECNPPRPTRIRLRIQDAQEAGAAAGP